METRSDEIWKVISMTKLKSRRKHDNGVDITQFTRMFRLPAASRYVTLPREILVTFFIRLSFSGFRQTKSDEGKNERDAQKFGFSASKSRACRLRQVVSGYWKRGRLVEGRTSYTAEVSEQEDKWEWFLSREMREPRNPSKDPAFKQRFLLPGPNK